MIAKKSENYAKWYLQQRAADQIVSAIQACRFSELDDTEIQTIVSVALKELVPA